MNYQDLYREVIKAKDPQTGVRGTRWENLILDKETQFIFPASTWAMNHRQYAHRDVTQLSNANLYVRPDNVMVFAENYRPTHFALAPFGISGRVAARISPLSEFTYVHNLFNKYETMPNMEIDFTTGKPIKARNLKNIRINQKKLLAMRKRTKELRHVFLSMVRVGDHKESDQNKTFRDTAERRVALEAAYLEVDGWFADLYPHYKFFARHVDPKKDDSKRRAFDNMLRFDQAAVFKFMGVIS